MAYNTRDMVQAIREIVTVEEGGVVRLRSAQLSPGDQVELIVLVEQASSNAADSGPGPSTWQRFAGAVKGTDANSADNEGIDDDLARAARQADAG